MQIATIIKGPHLLFTGANGKKTFGVEVQALDHDPTSGRSQFWGVNDCTFLDNPEEAKDKLGLSDERYAQLAAEFAACAEVG